MGLGQYNSLGEYCDPHTASTVFLILVRRMSCVASVLLLSHELGERKKRILIIMTFNNVWKHDTTVGQQKTAIG